MKIFELNEEIELAEQSIEAYAMENEGDITNCPFDTILEGLKLEKDEKVLSIGAWYKNLDAEAKALAETIKGLTARKSAVVNKQVRLKNFLSGELDKGRKLSDSKVAFSWRKSETVLLSCTAEELPKEYQNIKIEASKSELKKALKSGEEITGVELSKNQNIQIK